MEKSSQFVRLLDDRLTSVSEGAYNELPSMIPKLYNMQSSDKAWAEFYQVGDVPDIPEFGGVRQSLTIHPGYHTKIEHKEYGAILTQERKLMDDKRYDVLDGTAAGLGRAAYRTKEKQGARPLQNAFSSAFDYMTREEGVALCSSSHTTKSGTSTSSGFDNAGTSAMSKTTVAATRILMRKFRSDISERIEMGDDLAIICPDQLADTAGEITGTAFGMNTTENNKNMDYARYQVIPYLRLDDTSTTNWFMVNMSMMKRDLVWFDRIQPEFTHNLDFKTLVMEQGVYFRCSNGFKDWRWAYGHNV